MVVGLILIKIRKAILISIWDIDSSLNPHQFIPLRFWCYGVYLFFQAPSTKDWDEHFGDNSYPKCLNLTVCVFRYLQWSCLSQIKI